MFRSVDLKEKKKSLQLQSFVDHTLVSTNILIAQFNKQVGDIRKNPATHQNFSWFCGSQTHSLQTVSLANIHSAKLVKG